MSIWNTMLLLSVAVFTLTGIATHQLARYLREKSVMDIPNERSSHTIPNG